MIVIIDYHMGNVSSIKNMLKYIGFNDVIISNDIDIIKNASKIILPGVGAFDYGMKNIIDLNLIDVLNEKVLIEKTPTLGICLGMQLMTKRSEEGKSEGLKWIDAEVIKFDFDSDSTLKIPHVGWNEVEYKENILFKNLEKPRFYFVHSYYVKCNNDKDVLTKTEYGINFCSAFNKNNIFGVQFHPEKSHKFGMTILKNFITINK